MSLDASPGSRGLSQVFSRSPCTGALDVWPKRIRCVPILYSGSLDDQELRRGMCVAGRCHQEAAASSQLWGRAEGGGMSWEWCLRLGLGL